MSSIAKEIDNFDIFRAGHEYLIKKLLQANVSEYDEKIRVLTYNAISPNTNEIIIDYLGYWFKYKFYYKDNKVILGGSVVNRLPNDLNAKKEVQKNYRKVRKILKDILDEDREVTMNE